jgi:hypothetical protein
MWIAYIFILDYFLLYRNFHIWDNTAFVGNGTTKGVRFSDTERASIILKRNETVNIQGNVAISTKDGEKATFLSSVNPNSILYKAKCEEYITKMKAIFNV